MEKTKLNVQKKELEQQLNQMEEKIDTKNKPLTRHNNQRLQSGAPISCCSWNKEKEEKELDKLIENFLNFEKIDKIYLYRLINKIEIDKDKNIYIYFNFSELNLITENLDGFIKIEEIINVQNPKVV